MAQVTPYLGMSLYDPADMNTQTSENLLTGLMGLPSTSSLYVLDTTLYNQSQIITQLQQKSGLEFASATNDSGTNNFTITNSLFTAYTDNMIFACQFNANVLPSSTMRFASLTYVPIYTIDTSGQIVSLSTGDITTNKIVLLTYNATQSAFIYFGGISDGSISETKLSSTVQGKLSPTTTTSQGVVQVGSGINVSDGTISADSTSIGLGNVANVLQYSTSNPPPYPVTSVDGSTGNVVLNDVKFVSQTLTSEQQQQVLTNINGMGISGGTFTGNVFLNANPTSDLQASTKQYADTKIEEVLVWTNASPSSSFSGQTLTIPSTSGFDRYKILFYYNTTYRYTVTIEFEIGYPGLGFYSSYTSGGIFGATRVVNTSATSVSFGECTRATASTSTIENTSLIPYKIFLVKGVQ